jgi:hypothetical protein
MAWLDRCWWVTAAAMFHLLHPCDQSLYGLQTGVVAVCCRLKAT